MVRRRTWKREALTHPHGDDFRNPRLRHRDAVEDFGGLHRLLVVSDEDELGKSAHFVDHLVETIDIRVIQRGVHLIEEAKWIGLRQEDDEEKTIGLELLSVAGYQTA